MAKFTEDDVIQTFKNRSSFSRRELFEFYVAQEPELNESTFGWRVYDLKSKNIIQSVKRGQYVISNEPSYKPAFSPLLMELADLTVNKFSEVKHCIWETGWLNEFAQHQTNQSYLLLDVEKGFESSVFFEVRDHLSKEVFLNPTHKEVEFYIANCDAPIIIQNMITRSPLAAQKENGLTFYSPTLEKILVDTYTETTLFHFLQGAELINIFETVLSKYTINFTTLFSYAQRRGQAEAIEQFLVEHLYHIVKSIPDD